MKRSEINKAIKEASVAFERHHWYLPPNPKWDVTDFGLGEFAKSGLTAVNLSEHEEYCEKLMFVRQNQIVPNHYHKKKKEDIICRVGRLAIQLFSDQPSVKLQVNGEIRDVSVDKPLILQAGERVTLTPRVSHAFWSETEYTIVGEVSTANDDISDNFFDNPEIGRFSEIVEDEEPIVKLVSE